MKTTLLALLLLLAASVTAHTQTQNVIALEQGKLVEREISGNEIHSYNLTIPAGGYAHVDVEQNGISVSLTIFVDGQQQEIHDNAGGGDPELSLVHKRHDLSRGCPPLRQRGSAR